MLPKTLFEPEEEEDKGEKTSQLMEGEMEEGGRGRGRGRGERRGRGRGERRGRGMRRERVRVRGSVVRERRKK